MPTSLILINGPPASGKTSLAAILAQRLGLPLFSKDQLKESLFDTLGWGEREWSRKLGAACSELLFSIAESQLRVGQACILESNFHPQATLAHLTRLSLRYNFQLIQVVCVANTAILRERYNQRTFSGMRHPGHLDQLIRLEESDTLFCEPWTAITWDGRLIEVDTNQPECIDIEGLVRRVRQLVGEEVNRRGGDGVTG